MICFSLFIAFITQFLIGAHGQISLPSADRPVIDQAYILDENTKLKIESVLFKAKKAGLAQVQVVIVPTLKGETIESVSIRFAEQLRVGSAKADNGVLFLVALNDRQMRIEVGQGLEGLLTDLMAKRIIEDRVKPFFANGDFNSGIIAAVQSILLVIETGGLRDRLSDQYTVQNIHYRSGQRVTSVSREQMRLIEILFVILVILLRLFFPSLFMRRRRFNGSGWPGGGYSSGGRDIFGGGWSGGGGGFSGGGASGRW